MCVGVWVWGGWVGGSVCVYVYVCVCVSGRREGERKGDVGVFGDSLVPRLHPSRRGKGLQYELPLEPVT